MKMIKWVYTGKMPKILTYDIDYVEYYLNGFFEKCDPDLSNVSFGSIFKQSKSFTFMLDKTFETSGLIVARWIATMDENAGKENEENILDVDITIGDIKYELRNVYPVGIYDSGKYNAYIFESMNDHIISKL